MRFVVIVQAIFPLWNFSIFFLYFGWCASKTCTTTTTRENFNNAMLFAHFKWIPFSSLWILLHKKFVYNIKLFLCSAFSFETFIWCKGKGGWTGGSLCVMWCSFEWFFLNVRTVLFFKYKMIPSDVIFCRKQKLFLCVPLFPNLNQLKIHFKQSANRLASALNWGQMKMHHF